MNLELILVWLLGALCGALAVFLLSRQRRLPRARPLRAISVVRIGDGELEMTLSDYRRFRSTDNGRFWHAFPDGTTPSVSFDLWLNEECTRLQNIGRWSESEMT